MVVPYDENGSGYRDILHIDVYFALSAHSIQFELSREDCFATREKSGIRALV